VNKRLTPKMLQALRACAAGAVWQPLRDRGHCWQVDRKVYTTDYLGNVMVPTHKALQSRGLVEVTEGRRVCPYALAFGAGDPSTRVLLLTLTPEGVKLMTDPKDKPANPKPSETATEPAPREPLTESEMVDYMWDGTVDGEVFDGDPADLMF
jgi:hypothetical protein